LNRGGATILTGIAVTLTDFTADTVSDTAFDTLAA